MSGYIGPSPVPQSIQRRQSFTATAGQTTFGTTGYTDGDFIDVYLNGVKLVGGTDYTATNGSDIVLTTGASASDVLDFVTFNSLSLANHTFDESITLQNATEEDTDGGRETTIIFKGEQSGGEISTLAEIEASHDGTADDEKGDLIFRTNDGSDGSSPTEAARIDSAQNLIVGKTALDVSQEGVYLSSGQVGASKSGIPILANRLTSDGDILSFRKDGSTVGSIGNNGGYLHIGSPQGTDAYIGMGSSQVYPATSSGGYRDAAIDLGGDNERFKDLYLSGGVYLGGTGSANKLDDYEEGTWTPTITAGTTNPSITYTQQDGYYRKIGDLVYIAFDIRWSALSGGSGHTILSSLPFPKSNNGTYDGFSNITKLGITPSSGYANFSFEAGSGTNVTFTQNPTTGSGATTTVAIGNFSSSGYLISAFSYIST